MHQKIKELLKKGILVSPDMLEQEIDLEKIQKQEKKPFILGKDKQQEPEEPKELSAVKVIESYEEKNTKIAVKDFVFLYNNRYTLLQNILRQRQEMQHATTIRKAKSAEEKENVSFIGMVLESSITKNNNIILTLEDQTGTIKAVITKTNKEAFDIAKDITLDEVVGVSGTKGNNIVFVSSMVLPEIPLGKELKKHPENISALFISDIHIGAKAFLEKNFERFIEWLKGNIGNEKQRALVKKIKYLFVIGDIVDGIGIYPDQEKDLNIKDIYEQYAKFTYYMKQIPKEINIIVSPGNHDSLRIAEPQPALPKEVANELYEMPNVTFVSSPAYVNVGETKDFSGFDVLIYHGFSFPYYADAIESIRHKGGLENTDNIMQFLLKKRHLAPTHGSTQYQLGYDKDPLVIKQIPDFFATGHIHRASLKNYKNITMLNCSCWISQTDYQEKRGLVPQPCRAIYVNLSTRESKILNFSEQ